MFDFRRLTTGAVAAIATVAALAGASAQAEEYRFGYRPADLNYPSGVTATYVRIESKADAVCGASSGRRALWAIRAGEACKQDVMQHIVSQIGDPRLAALHAGKVRVARK